jgi:hypothetical protein
VTKLNTPVRRSVPGLTRRDLIITLYPGGVIGIRESRCKKEYTLPLMSCYRLAIEADRAAAKREKQRLKAAGKS